VEEVVVIIITTIRNSLPSLISKIIITITTATIMAAVANAVNQEGILIPL
jgi:hypothetical protein